MRSFCRDSLSSPRGLTPTPEAVNVCKSGTLIWLLRHVTCACACTFMCLLLAGYIPLHFLPALERRARGETCVKHGERQWADKERVRVVGVPVQQEGHS